MNILFIGSLKKFSFSRYTYEILNEKNNVDVIDIDKFFFSNFILYTLLYNLNSPIVENWLYSKFNKSINKKYDLIFTTAGELFGKKILINLKKRSKLVFLCLDNPFFNNDKLKWSFSKKALHLYDKVIFQQPTRVKYALKHKIKYSLIPPLINKKIHRPININLKNRKYRRDILIIGTWFKEREKLAEYLIKKKLNLEIIGSNWKKAKNYNILKNYIKFSNGLVGKKYAEEIFFSKIVICLPNSENDDDITNKSLEIPACGSLLVAKNTKSHKQIFKNNYNAILFNNNKDLLKKLNKILANKEKINAISKNGFKRVFYDNKFNYKNNLNKIINKLA